MARRVLVHVGPPKTGTTFLQTALWHNRDQLRAQGLLYPGRQRLDHYNAYQQIRASTREWETRPRGEGPWIDLLDELAAWPGRGLISHEFFSMATLRQAERVVRQLAPAEVHVVLTVRSYVRQFPAMWQEAVKINRTDTTFDAFMDDALDGSLDGAWSWRSQDLVAVLERWGSVVPADRIHVVTAPPPGSPRDLLWQRFCATIEVDPAGFDLDTGHANESLGAAQVALLRHVKRHLSGPLLDGPFRHRWLRRYLGHEVLVPQDGARFSPRPGQAARLDAEAERAVAFIEAGGYPVAGDLADLRSGSAGPTRSSGAVVDPDAIADEELLDVAARAIEQMVRDVAELTAERDHWRAEARGAQGRTPAGRARTVAGRLRRRGSEPTSQAEPREEES